jgi:hypothetical protein
VPDGGDWGLKLIYEGPNDPNNRVAELKYIRRRELYLRTYLPYAAGVVLITIAGGISIKFKQSTNLSEPEIHLSSLRS